MDELRPCPFCGGRAQLNEFRENDGQCHFQSCSICCTVCGCRTSNYIIDGYLGIKHTKDEVIEAWNRRVDNATD